MHRIAHATLILAGLLPVVHASLPAHPRPGPGIGTASGSPSYPGSSPSSAASSVSSRLPPRSYFEARVDPRDPPVLAIRRHLAEVEAHLRALPPLGLDAARSAARAARLDDLRAYRLRGEFPRNMDFPGRLVPYFIDDRDVACAVGHLIRVSGARAFAEEVARTDNHVYIPDLRDPRLDEWAYANGFSRAELARIQPSYGYAPQDIQALIIDSRNRPWVVAGFGGMSMNMSVFGLDASDRWSTPSAPWITDFAGFCSVGDRPLVIHEDASGRKLSFQGSESIHPELGRITGTPCVGTRNGTGLLVGGLRGMHLYGFAEGGRPTRLDSMRAGVDNFPSDTVTHLAWPGAVMWAGTARGLAHRGAARDWTVIPYASLGGASLGGLASGSGTNIWAGTLARQTGWAGTPLFSETGLVSLVGNGGPTRYHRGNSPLPSDTILLAAAGPDRSVWLTCDRKKLLRFTPPDTLVTLPFTLPDHVHRLEVDSLDRPYLGTYAPSMGSSQATGLYRVDGDSLVPLGYPLGPPIAVARELRKAAGPGHRSMPPAPGPIAGRLDALGRRIGRAAAAGMYLPPATAAP